MEQLININVVINNNNRKTIVRMNIIIIIVIKMIKRKCQVCIIKKIVYKIKLIIKIIVISILILILMEFYKVNCNLHKMKDSNKLIWMINESIIYNKYKIYERISWKENIFI